MRTLTAVVSAIALVIMLPEMARCQDTTSVFELKLVNSSNKLVPSKDVDLYQSAVKKYDLTESASIPGVYLATVKLGEYDIYVNGSSWKTGIWIGANKLGLIAELFRFTAGPDTLHMVGHVRATSFEGDGSKITGIVGSVGESTGDLILGADSDTSGAGEIKFRIAKDARVYLNNEGKLVVGNVRAGVTTDDPIFQVHTDTTDGLMILRDYGLGQRNFFFLIDDFSDEMLILSSKTAAPNPPGDAWPIKISNTDNWIKIAKDSTIIDERLQTHKGASLNDDRFVVYDDSTVSTKHLRLHAGMRFLNMLFSGYTLKTSASGQVIAAAPEPDWQPAIAGFPTPENGSVLDTLGAFEEVLVDSAANADTTIYEFRVKSDAAYTDSLVMLVSTPSSAGDSVGYVAAYRVRGRGDNVTGAFTGNDTAYADLGTSAEKMVAVTFLTNFSLFAYQGETLFVKIWRIHGFANDVNAVTRRHRLELWRY